jgi:1-acyl-sn-glycerol-3-phosphate acyltransferase
LFFDLKVYGSEFIPASGGVIIAGNHTGVIEVPLALYYLKRTDIIILIAEKYQKRFYTRWIVNLFGGIFIDRHNADFAALRETLKRLREGGMLLIAPEGTRSQDGQLASGYMGAAYLAAKTGLPILPGAATGNMDRKVIGSLLKLRRPEVVARAGKPFTLPPLPARDREKVLKEYTDEIMCRIAALLPEEDRGAYRDHPRLQEILSESQYAG